MRHTIRLLVGLLLVASCGSTGPEIIAVGPGSAGLSGCQIDGSFAELRYGMPTYDYDRQETLEGLIDQASSVVRGALIKAEWVSGSNVLTIADPSPLLFSDENFGPELTISYQTSDEGATHPLEQPLVIDPPREIIAFLGPELFNGHREVLLQGVILRCSDEQTLSIIESLPPDAASLEFFELEDTISFLAPPRVTRPTGPTEPVAFRLLDDGLSEGEPWTTGIVAPGTAGIDADWDSEVVFEFNLAESSSCPFGSMESLMFDQLNNVLFPVVPLAGDYEACTDDANSHLIRVAVSRVDLPGDSFDLWVNGDEPPNGVREGVTRVEVSELG